MLPETNIDKSPYTYVKKLQKELYFIDFFLEKRLIFNFHYEKFIECIYGQVRIFWEFNMIVSRTKRLLDVHEIPLEYWIKLLISKFLLVRLLGSVT